VPRPIHSRHLIQRHTSCASSRRALIPSVALAPRKREQPNCSVAPGPNPAGVNQLFRSYGWFADKCTRPKATSSEAQRCSETHDSRRLLIRARDGPITLRLEGRQLEFGEDVPSYQQGRGSAEVVVAEVAVAGWTICWWEAHY
jgi:hypothetical protein